MSCEKFLVNYRIPFFFLHILSKSLSECSMYVYMLGYVLMYEVIVVHIYIYINIGVFIITSIKITEVTI